MHLARLRIVLKLDCPSLVLRPGVLAGLPGSLISSGCWAESGGDKAMIDHRLEDSSTVADSTEMGPGLRGILENV